MTTLHRELLRHREVSQCELPGPGTSGMKIRHFCIKNYRHFSIKKHKVIIDSTLRQSEPQPESLLVKKGSSSTDGLEAETSDARDTPWSQDAAKAPRTLIDAFWHRCCDLDETSAVAVRNAFGGMLTAFNAGQVHGIELRYDFDQSASAANTLSAATVRVH